MINKSVIEIDDFSKDESRAVLKILNNVKGPQKIMKKNRLLEQLEEAGLVDKNYRVRLSKAGLRVY
jgi:ribosomal protein S19E (S16A)